MPQRKLAGPARSFAAAFERDARRKDSATNPLKNPCLCLSPSEERRQVSAAEAECGRNDGASDIDLPWSIIHCGSSKTCGTVPTADLLMVILLSLDCRSHDRLFT